MVRLGCAQQAVCRCLTRALPARAADFARYFQQLEELGTKNLKSITA
jgi:hypothetical protein